MQQATLLRLSLALLALSGLLLRLAR